jgi:hypothetical protein
MGRIGWVFVARGERWHREVVALINHYLRGLEALLGIALFIFKIININTTLQRTRFAWISYRVDTLSTF